MVAVFMLLESARDALGADHIYCPKFILPAGLMKGEERVVDTKYFHDPLNTSRGIQHTFTLTITSL